MFSRLADWLDHRTGYRKLLSALLLEHIPGGAKWRYVWGSALAFVFLIQLITGILLMTAYSPGETTAWGSVYYIQYQMEFGWLIRGLHHFGSQAMVVLLGVHMLQVVIAGAHLPPREVNWWLGLLLMGAVLGLSLTGYLLPWDQKGYWATRVATNIVSTLPVAGPWLQQVIVGGPEYGHHTLTRFYALHVGILPPLVIILMIAHVAVFRRHGVTHPKHPKGEGLFWPDQAFRDMLVGMAIFGGLLTLATMRHGHKIETPQAQEQQSAWEAMAYAGRDGRGANLDAPANPDKPYNVARPEWYFLFLFQLLKYFPGDLIIVGTVIIPQAVGLLLFLLPLFGYGAMRKFGHALGVVVVLGVLTGAGILTALALHHDYGDHAVAKSFQEQVSEEESKARRAVQLAMQGVPPEGPRYLLARDPLTAGRDLFKQKCAACHRHGDDFKVEAPRGMDLKGFGTEAWIHGLLKEPKSPKYFGSTPHLQTMANWVEGQRARAEAADKKMRDAGQPEKATRLKQLEDDFALIARWLGKHPRQDIPANEDRSAYAVGYRAFESRCMECHKYRNTGGESSRGPDMDGYGDAHWLERMIVAPHSPSHYGLKNRMPIFRDLQGRNAQINQADHDRLLELWADAAGGDDPAVFRQKLADACKLMHLSDVERELIIRFILGDSRLVR